MPAGPTSQELNRPLQKLAAERKLADFDSGKREHGVQARKRSGRPQPKTMQAEYVRKAEAEIAKKGGYSWVADIRGRIALARSVAGNEVEFKALLGELGVIQA